MTRRVATLVGPTADRLALGAVRTVAPVLALARTPARQSLTRLFGTTDLSRDDYGLFGPGSATWEIHSHPCVFAGAQRALLVQAMHPEVVAGVMDHSHYKQDPLGRLRRTSAWVTTVSFASTADALAAIDGLARGHARVTGTSHRGRPYTAGDPDLLAWVHNAFTYALASAYDLVGPGLTPALADAYTNEQRQVGERLGCLASDLPRRWSELVAWLDNHPDLGPSPGLVDALGFLASPPLPLGYQLPYRILFAAAGADLPPNLAVLAPQAPLGAVTLARATLEATVAVLGPHPHRS